MGEAIEQVDALTDGAARFFMVNCAHPTHFAEIVEQTTHVAQICDAWLG